MGNGFQINNIEFKSTQTVFEISQLDEQTFDTIQNDWERIAANIETFGNNKLKIYFDSE